MREILFRGKLYYNGEWVYWDIYGRLTDINGEPTKVEINTSAGCLRPYTFFSELPIINDETVGEYTGLTDKNGKRIFEGDIVADAYGWKGLVEFFTEDIGSCGCCVPQFDGSGFKAKYKKLDSGVDMRSCTIVGNIHDNPEMWEVEK